MIELGNSPYPGSDTGAGFGQGGLFAFPGDTSFVGAEDVLIENLRLGRSSHWSVHGARTKGLHLENVVCEQFQVGAVVLDAGDRFTYNNLCMRSWD